MLCFLGEWEPNRVNIPQAELPELRGCSLLPWQDGTGDVQLRMPGTGGWRVSPLVVTFAVACSAAHVGNAWASAAAAAKDV